MSATLDAVKPFTRVRRFSTGAVFLAILLSLIFRTAFGSDSMGWQIALALIALTIGIPHGAVDHLITIPRTSLVKFWLFIVSYVLVAVVAALAIFHWNVIGFQLVALMSALHFGFGDASYLAESGEKKMGRIAQTLYALAAGSLPVVIPLVNSKSSSALQRVHPELVGWAGGAARSLEVTVWILAGAAVLYLIATKSYRFASDLVLLALLALVAPPLVAFAVYFGCWHATRHTARLTLLLPPSTTPLMSAFKAGVPALVGTVVVASGIVLFKHQGFDSALLWSLLVVIWALTVPHMATTARFDLRSLK